jgi:broad specificity phosphatase PhoE
MAPTLHLVRHAQGYHNLSAENEKLPDPDLTPLGIQQCADLRAKFPYHDKLRGLVASGMRRTLYTCINSFGTDELYPVVALDTLQEVSDAPSDTGSSVEKLEAEFGDKVDLSRIRKGWNSKGEGSYFEPALDKLPTRARDARLALRKIAASLGDDAHIAVVSHGAFLHFLTEEWHGITETYRKIQFPLPLLL